MPPSKLRLSAADKRILIAFYKDAMSDLIKSIDRHVWSNPANPRLVALLNETKKILGELDSRAEKWAEGRVKTLYFGNVRFVDDKLRGLPISFKAIDAASRTAKIHQDAIRNLLLNPSTGITPRIQAASRQVGQSVESFIRQNRVLFRQQQLIAREVGKNILTGGATREARDRILGSLLQSGEVPKKGFMGLNPLLQTSRSLIEAPYLVKSDGRRIHIFDHVQMTATTMESKVRTDARNTRMIQNGIHLVQITPNPPLTECVCSLYAGRVFSLDPETERRTGYPWIARTPSGGPPFHPYCTHSTLPWVEEFVPDEDLSEATDNTDAGTKSFKGTPSGALNKTWAEAQKFFKSKGGAKFAIRQNPSMASRWKP